MNTTVHNFIILYSGIRGQSIRLWALWTVRVSRFHSWIDLNCSYSFTFFSSSSNVLKLSLTENDTISGYLDASIGTSTSQEGETATQYSISTSPSIFCSRSTLVGVVCFLQPAAKSANGKHLYSVIYMYTYTYIHSYVYNLFHFFFIIQTLFKMDGNLFKAHVLS